MESILNQAFSQADMQKAINTMDRALNELRVGEYNGLSGLRTQDIPQHMQTILSPVLEMCVALQAVYATPRMIDNREQRGRTAADTGYEKEVVQPAINRWFAVAHEFDKGIAIDGHTVKVPIADMPLPLAPNSLKRHTDSIEINCLRDVIGTDKPRPFLSTGSIAACVGDQPRCLTL